MKVKSPTPIPLSNGLEPSPGIERGENQPAIQPPSLQLKASAHKNDKLKHQGESAQNVPFSPVQRKEDHSQSEVSRMGEQMGANFSNVKIHADSEKASHVGALAYTQGNDIHFAPGQFKPDTQQGKELLGHELTHVKQQQQGRVKPTTEVNGLPINDDQSLENEADTVGRTVAQGKFIQKKEEEKDSQELNNQASQMKTGHDDECSCDSCSGAQMKKAPGSVSSGAATQLKEDEEEKEQTESQNIQLKEDHDHACSCDSCSGSVQMKKATLGHTPVQRTGDPASDTAAAQVEPSPIDQIVDDVYKALKGMGTDEIGLIEALTRLNQDNTKIEAFKSAFTTKYNYDPVQWIQEDLSNNYWDGDIEDLALRLLNIKTDEALSEVIETTTATIKVKKSLNVRSTPDTSNNDNIVRKLKNGDVVNVIQEKEGWIQIAENEWISAKFAVVKTEESIEYDEEAITGLVDKAYFAMQGAGTDETGLLNALSQLDNKPDIIEKFRAIYLDKYGENIEDRIDSELNDWFTDSKYYVAAMNMLGIKIEDEPEQGEPDQDEKDKDKDDKFKPKEGDSDKLKELKENEYKTYLNKDFTISGNDIWARNSNFDPIDENGSVVSNPDSNNVKKIPPGTYKVDDVKFRYNEIPKNSDGSLKGQKYFSYRTGFAYIKSVDAWVDIKSAFGKQFNGEYLGVTEAEYVSTNNTHKTVGNPKAVLRKKEGDEFVSLEKTVSQGSFVIVTQEEGTYSHIKLAKPKEGQDKITNVKDGWDEEDLGWTATSNLVDNWSDIYASTSMWKRTSDGPTFIGQTDVIENYSTSKRLAMGPSDDIINMLAKAEEDGVWIGLNSGFREFKKQQELHVRNKGGEPGIYSPATAGCSNHQNGTAYDLSNADYTSGTYTKSNGKEKSYKYAKLPGDGMNDSKKKADRWLRQNAGDYGLALTLKMTNERHHWEYLGPTRTKGLSSYVTFTPPGGKAKPSKGESFSLRRNSTGALYMKTEAD